MVFILRKKNNQVIKANNFVFIEKKKKTIEKQTKKNNKETSLTKKNGVIHLDAHLVPKFNSHLPRINSLNITDIFLCLNGCRDERAF